MSFKKEQNFAESCEKAGGNLVDKECNLGSMTIKYDPNEDTAKYEYWPNGKRLTQSPRSEISMKEPVLRSDMDDDLLIEGNNYDMEIQSIPDNLKEEDFLEDLCDMAKKHLGEEMVSCYPETGNIDLGHGRHPTSLELYDKGYKWVATGDFPVNDIHSVVGLANIGDVREGDEKEADCSIDAIHQHEGTFHPHISCKVDEDTEKKRQGFEKLFDILDRDSISNYGQVIG
jgi:hypothetical protein